MIIVWEKNGSGKPGEATARSKDGNIIDADETRTRDRILVSAVRFSAADVGVFERGFVCAA